MSNTPAANVLGLILARGGSKRVPKKNLRLLDNIPLICWTVHTAQLSRALDRIVVSSDDREILEVSNQWGADTIERPSELASDQASSYLAMLHALSTLDEPFEYLCLLQPTSPFRMPEDIDTCIGIATVKSECSVVSFEEGKTVPNGAVYVGRIDWLRDRIALGDRAPFDGPNPSRYYMPATRSLDIDTEADFACAEAWVS